MLNAFSRIPADRRFGQTAENRLVNGRSGMLSTLPKSVTISPIKGTSLDSSNAMGQDKKRIKSVLCSFKQPFSATKASISKKNSSFPTMDTENDVISVLKKLPEISFFVVPSASVFKFPTFDTKNTIPYDESKIVYGKKVLSECTDNNVLSISDDKLEKVRKMNSNLKISLSQVQKPNNNNNNNMPLIHNNAIKRRISRNPKKTLNINLLSEKKNVPKTSSPLFKLPNFSQFQKFSEFQVSQIQSKNLETEIKVSNDSILSDEVKINTNNDLNKSSPMNFNVYTPEYDRFLMGMSTSLNSTTMQFDTSHNYVEKELLTGQGNNMCTSLNLPTTQFDTLQSHVEKELLTGQDNKMGTFLNSTTMQFDTSQSCVEKEWLTGQGNNMGTSLNIPTTKFDTLQSHVENELLTGQDYKMGKSLNSTTMQCDTSQSCVEKELLTGQYNKIALNMNVTHNINFNSGPQFHNVEGNSNDYLDEQNHEGNSVDCIKSLEEILPNNLHGFSNMNTKCVIKKNKKVKNEPRKKQKIEKGNETN